jgi:hypothetical protein
MEENEARLETLKHIDNVKKMIRKIINQLELRGRLHDASKLVEPEVSTFNIYTEKLKNSTYGSEEYKQFLKEMKPALDHHYKENRHHPEHFKKFVCNGCFREYDNLPERCCCGYSQFQEEPNMDQMNMIDLMEMFCDWKAATLRHSNGDLMKSIEINSERFKISPQLQRIFKNSVKLFEEE